MRRVTKQLIIKGVLPCLVLVCVFALTPQKVNSVDCCKHGSKSFTAWSFLGEVECPESEGNYCYMKRRTVTVTLSDCATIATCPDITYDCTWSQSTTTVTIQYPDCTDAVTDQYREWEITAPCDSEETCFWNCSVGENPWEHLRYGDCPDP